MSDTSSRRVGGPPKRAAKAPASSLIKRNRPQPSLPATSDTEAVPADQLQSAPSAPSAEQPAGESSTPGTLLDRPDPIISAPSTVAPVEPAAEVRAPEPTVSVQPVVTEAVAVTAPSAPVQEDTLVNTTFRVRRSAKKAFDAAFIAAKLHEGWPSAEAYFQDLLERETKRIQDSYNNGQPFPIREKALPRGRPIGS